MLLSCSLIILASRIMPFVTGPDPRRLLPEETPAHADTTLPDRGEPLGHGRWGPRGRGRASAHRLPEERHPRRRQGTGCDRGAAAAPRRDGELGRVLLRAAP